jgi:hypothetical protein
VDADGSGCRSLVGRYVDAAREEGAGARTGDTVRTRTLGQVLDLDPSTGASVPDAERAVEVLQVAADRYSLSLSKTTLPDAVVVWDAAAQCVGDTLRLQSASRYQSSDGVHVTRQKLSVALYGDADSSLILRRDLRQRALGLIDLRSGGGQDIETWRFHRLEGRPGAR